MGGAVMPRRINKRKTLNERALWLLAEAQDAYHRVNRHPSDSAACPFCEIEVRDFSVYLLGGSIDVAKMYRERLEA